jgi:hypothetical protein
MDKVHKPTDSKCYAPSSEPFRLCYIVMVTSPRSQNKHSDICPIVLQVQTFLHGGVPFQGMLSTAQQS